MGDFERIFGAGADVLKIIDSFKHDDSREITWHYSYFETVYFYTLEAAEEFCNENPSGRIKLFEPNFIGGRLPVRHISHEVTSIDSEGFFLNEGHYKRGKNYSHGVHKKFKINIEYIPNKKLDTLVRKLFGKRLISGRKLNIKLFQDLIATSCHTTKFVNSPPRNFRQILSSLIESGYICHTLSEDTFIVFTESGTIKGIFQNKFGYTFCNTQETLIESFILKPLPI